MSGHGSERWIAPPSALLPPGASAAVACDSSGDIFASCSSCLAFSHHPGSRSGASNKLATIRRNSGLSSSEPNPGTSSGLVKSHWFSAGPTKSRMVGSVTHARRSAARVSSSGTPRARNARTSLVAVMASIGGSAVGANAGRSGSSSAGALGRAPPHPPLCAPAAVAPRPQASASWLHV
jgi:hypothetical protein